MLKVLMAGLLVVLVAAGIYVVSSNNSKEPPPVSSPASSSNDTSTPSTGGQYIDYYDGVIAATKGQKILFFHAPWCPQCRALDQDIKNSQIPSDVTIIKTDYDSMQSLRQKYGVTLQTTLVKIDDSGNLQKKYVAYNQPTWQAVASNLL